MLLLSLKKIVKNKWLMLSLFAGILLSVIIACSIPIYSAGISQRMLVTELQNYQRNEGVHPGTLRVSTSLTNFKQDTNAQSFQAGNDKIEKDIIPSLMLPQLVNSTCISTNSIYFSDVRYNDAVGVTRKADSVIVRALNNYEGSVTIVAGRLPLDVLDSNGSIEVMVSRAAEQKLNVILDGEYQLAESLPSLYAKTTTNPVTVKVVGIFDYSGYAYTGLNEKDTGIEMYANFQLAYDQLLVQKSLISKATWYFVGDYSALKPNDMTKFYNSLVSIQQWTKAYSLQTSTTMPPIDVVQDFNTSLQSVQLLLVMFYLPILMLLIFFIFMITKLVVDNDKNELAVLRSRGASKWQLLSIYLMQSGLMAGISLIIAPFAALFLCRMLGATSGFMEFGQRAPIMLSLSFATIIYGVIAALLVIITMTVPALMASGIEIVEQKLLKAQKKYVPLWKKLYLDVILLLVTAYGYYTYLTQQALITTTNATAGSISLDPITYLLIILFLIGAGLFFLRIYPMVIMLIFRIGRKRLHPPLYSSLTRVGRMQGREQFLIIFLVMTIAMGFFNANSAQTMNTNMNEKVLYKGGADMILTPSFEDVPGAVLDDGTVMRPFLFNDLKGVLEATKVVVGKTPKVTYSGKAISENISFMAVNPQQFADVVWWRYGIGQQHLNDYLSMLSREPDGCIISTNTQKLLNVGINQTINITPDSKVLPTKSQTNVITARVLAVVDDWPTYYPTITDDKGTQKDNYLVVTNLVRVEAAIPNLDYQAWLKTDGVQSVAELKATLLTRSVIIKSAINTKSDYLNSQTSAIRQATNGSLTLGFLVIMLVCILGFVIYWVLSIRGRVLQIGTMRALGMPVRQVYQMIFWEQVLLSGAAIILGIVLGGAASSLFVPILQAAFGAVDQVPPFRIVSAVSDFVKIYSFVGILLASGMLLAFVMLKQIKAAAAIKLGEE